MTVEYLTGDSLETMRLLPDNSVDLSVCSPPFLALRNYNDLDGQWGSEPDPSSFLDNLLELATETRRVLAPHGSLAWEIGDTYSGSGGSGGDYNKDGLREGQNKFTGSAARNGKGADVTSKDKWASSDKRPGWPLAKSLTMVPTLFAASLAYGHNLLNPDHTFEPWRVRNMIVWARNNPPVGRLGDKFRPAVSYITVACPSKDRWFDLDAVRVDPKHGFTSTRSIPFTQPARNIDGQPARKVNGPNEDGERIECNPAGAPPKDFWTDEHPPEHMHWLVNGQPSKLAHYAMWPPKLAERLVLSMCPLEVCNECGEPRRRVTETERTNNGNPTDLVIAHPNQASSGGGEYITQRGTWGTNVETVGWSDCDHDNYRPGVVCDPFAGTGTTVLVADAHGRDGIAIDLDPANRDLLEMRRDEVMRSLFGTKPQLPGQTELFA